MTDIIYSSRKTPAHYSWYINTMYYKQGKHGMVFIWIDGEWIRSTKTVKELENLGKITETGTHR